MANVRFGPSTPLCLVLGAALSFANSLKEDEQNPKYSPNYGPFLGPLNARCTYYKQDPKKEHDFDNHPHASESCWTAGSA